MSQEWRNLSRMTDVEDIRRVCVENSTKALDELLRQRKRHLGHLTQSADENDLLM